MLRTVTRRVFQSKINWLLSNRWGGVNMSRAGPGVGSLHGKGRGPGPGSLYGEGCGFGNPMRVVVT